MKKGKSCKKGYSCGAGCISVTYACNKDFPEGISVSIDATRKVIQNQVGLETSSKVTPKKETPKKETPKKETPKKETPKKEETKGNTSEGYSKKADELQKEIDGLSDKDLPLKNKLREKQKLYTNASNAKNPEEFMAKVKELKDAQKALDDYLENPKKGVKTDELVKRINKAEGEVKAAYTGEPTTPRKFEYTDKRGEVSKDIPGTLPKGNKTKTDKEAQAFMDNAKMSIQTDVKGLEGIISDGKFKNGFEKGTDGIGKDNEYYYDIRKEGESDVLGIKTSTKANKRPIYAYLEHPDRVESRGSEVGQLYGEIRIQLKDDVKNRSTVTIGDSLDDYARFDNPLKATPVNNVRLPKQVSIDKGDGGLTTDGFMINGGDRSARGLPMSYIEAQVHGGLKTSDIEKVIIPRGSNISKTTLDNLKSQGIIVEFARPPMQDVNYSNLTID